MTAAIIAMAHGLRLSVDAEGVETVGQALLLRQPGRDEVQGDLFGQPSPPEDTKNRMRARPVPIDAESKDDSWDLYDGALCWADSSATPGYDRRAIAIPIAIDAQEPLCRLILLCRCLPTKAPPI